MKLFLNIVRRKLKKRTFPLFVLTVKLLSRSIVSLDNNEEYEVQLELEKIFHKKALSK